MECSIRFAEIDDAGAILEFYGPLIDETAISFETRPLTLAVLENRIQSIKARYPWIVCEIDGSIAGFSYAGPHRTKTGYLWSVETSVYVSSESKRRGVGTALYKSLFALLEVQGFQMAYAGITIPNDASSRLHKSLGFTEVGIYRNAGYKLGSWHDAAWWQRQIGRALPDRPQPPLCPDEALLSDIEKWKRALASGADSIR